MRTPVQAKLQMTPTSGASCWSSLTRPFQRVRDRKNPLTVVLDLATEELMIATLRLRE